MKNKERILSNLSKNIEYKSRFFIINDKIIKNEKENKFNNKNIPKKKFDLLNNKMVNSYKFINDTIANRKYEINNNNKTELNLNKNFYKYNNNLNINNFKSLTGYNNTIPQQNKNRINPKFNNHFKNKSNIIF